MAWTDAVSMNCSKTEIAYYEVFQFQKLETKSLNCKINEKRNEMESSEIDLIFRDHTKIG